MTSIRLNPVLLDFAKQAAGLDKRAFIPAGQDPAAGGGAPPGGDPSQAGGTPPGSPPGGDPSMGGAPPPAGGDPAAAGGAPPPGGAPGGSLPNELVGLITQTIQQQMAMGGGAGGAAGGGGPKKSKGGDEVAMQLYKTNVFLMAIITALNKAGMEVEIPPEAMLGPPPGSDPAMAGQAGMQVPAGQPGVAQPGAPGADPNAAAGGQPQQTPFVPSLAPKTAEDAEMADEDELLAMGIPISKEAVATNPLPQVMQEMFGGDAEPAQAAPTTTQKASAVLEMIEAARRNRQTQ